jgi:hypothetical protein
MRNGIYQKIFKVFGEGFFMIKKHIFLSLIVLAGFSAVGSENQRAALRRSGSGGDTSTQNELKRSQERDKKVPVAAVVMWIDTPCGHGRVMPSHESIVNIKSWAPYYNDCP